MPLRKTAHIALALLLGVCAALTVFAALLQPLGGNPLRVGALLAILIAGLAWGAGWLLARYVYPAMARLKWPPRIGWMLMCLLAGFGLVASLGLRPEEVHFLFPRHSLVIQPTGQRNPASSGDQVVIRYLADGETYQFDLKTFAYSNEWFIENGSLQTNTEGAPAATWKGSLLNRGRLALKSGPDAGIVSVTWDGQAQVVDLYASGAQLVYLKLDVSNPPARPFRLAAALAFGLTFGFAFLALMTFWLALPGPGSLPGRKKPGRLWFALPMLAGWGLYLAVFFPGILSSDSTDQWSMILGLKPVTDWHPAAHTLLWELVTQVWQTPAAMALVQIAALSLVAAWGIGILIDLGLPTWGGWLISLLFAVSPVNGAMIITMWKDVPYAIGLFGLFLVGIRVVMSRGEWADYRGRWVGIGLAGAAVGLFRHNGALVAAVVLVGLLLVYRRHWRGMVKGIGLGLVIWALVTGPVYSLARVRHVSDVLADTILLHHFGAHVIAGTPLTDEERSYFNDLQPLNEWKYYCCNVTPLYFDPGFNQSLFEANRDRHLRIFFDLLLRDPMVDVRHTLCSSGLVWKMCNDCSFLGPYILPDGATFRWVEPNNLGLEQASRLPGLVTPFASAIVASSQPPWFSLVWSPAFYLLLALLGTLLFAIWQRKWSILLIGLAPVVQSATLFLINISNDFRYQYGVYLIGLYSIGMILLCLVQKERDPQA